MMLKTDRRALLCDVAETYRIYSFSAVPVVVLATLCAGLSPDSRIRAKMAGRKPVATHEMFAMIADNLSVIRYGLFSESSAQKPLLFVDEMYVHEPASKYVLFESGDDFRAAWDAIVGG